jgi:Holliday junction resolvase
MANPNGRKGAQFETDVMRWLRDNEAVAERLTKAGAKDEGDLYVFMRGKTYILELKNRKKLDLPAFWDEAQVEAKNYAKARGLADIPPAFVIVKRRNHSVKNAWVIQNLEQWMRERHE